MELYKWSLVEELELSGVLRLLFLVLLLQTAMSMSAARTLSACWSARHDYQHH